MALILVGNVVRLVPLSLDHVGPLLEAARRERTTYGLTDVPVTHDAMVVYVERALAEQVQGRSVPFATTLATNGEVVGSTRFMTMETWVWPGESTPRRRDGSPDGVEIGWTWLSADVQRTAVNTEAKLLMLTHAFEVWRVHRVTLKTDSRNARSRAAIERLGATLDGVLRAHMPASDGRIRDTAFYSIVASEWPRIGESLRGRLAKEASQ